MYWRGQYVARLWPPADTGGPIRDNVKALNKVGVIHSIGSEVHDAAG